MAAGIYLSIYLIDIFMCRGELLVRLLALTASVPEDPSTLIPECRYTLTPESPDTRVPEDPAAMIPSIPTP